MSYSSELVKSELDRLDFGYAVRSRVWQKNRKVVDMGDAIRERTPRCKPAGKKDLVLDAIAFMCPAFECGTWPLAQMGSAKQRQTL